VSTAIAELDTEKTAITRELLAGAGLTGGGNFSADRTISLDIVGQTEETAPTAANHFVVTWDTGASAFRKVKLSNLPGGGSGTTFEIDVDGVGEETVSLLKLYAGANTSFATAPVSGGEKSITINSDFGYITTTGSANAYLAALPGTTSYTAGLKLRVKANFANTGAATLNIESVGAKSIKKKGASSLSDLAANDILSGGVYDMVYETACDCIQVLSGVAPATGGSSATRHNTEIVKDTFMANRNSNGAYGDLSWTGAGGTKLAYKVAGLPGVVRAQTATTINTVNYMVSTDNLNSTIGSFDITTPGTTRYYYRVNQTDADYVTRIGFACATATAAQPQAGAWFEKTGTDTNWQRVVRNASTETKADTGIPVDTNWNWFILRTTGTGVGFTIGTGGTESIITTNMPTAPCSYWVMITNTTAADKSYDIDYFESEFPVSRP
jgi:hypothetical protein